METDLAEVHLGFEPERSGRVRWGSVAGTSPAHHAARATSRPSYAASSMLRTLIAGYGRPGSTTKPCSAMLAAIWCQSASNFDPRSASNFDPLERRVRAVALAPSELVGVAETARARVGE